jgi:hypothetical protein
VLHEIGHAAGNHGHATGCASSPMNESIGLGEWWRTPRDNFRLGCVRAALGRAASAMGRLEHRSETVDEVRTVRVR